MVLGHLAAQITHAAGESSPGNLPKDTFAVVLAVENEAILLELHEKLVFYNIDHVLIREPDPPFNGGATAIGVKPDLRENIGKYFKKFKLLK